MKKLLEKFGESINSGGHQFITVSSIEDFYDKLYKMGGKYKGFIVTEKLEGFCMLYIDTEEMRRIQEAVECKLQRYRFRTDPIERLKDSFDAKMYVERFISGYTAYSLLDTYYHGYIPPRPKRTGIKRWLFGE